MTFITLLGLAFVAWLLWLLLGHGEPHAISITLPFRYLDREWKELGLVIVSVAGLVTTALVSVVAILQGENNSPRAPT